MRRPTTIAFRMLIGSAALALVITVAMTALVLAVSSLRRAIDAEAKAKDTLTAALRLQTATGELESSLARLPAHLEPELPGVVGARAPADSARRAAARCLRRRRSGAARAGWRRSSADIRAYVSDYAQTADRARRS